jgi:predicted enzyme related to lactoylglutathione lyase
MTLEFLGLRSLIYPAADLEKSKSWWIAALGKEPYFDDGGYVGFDLHGYELGLNSHSQTLHGPITYIGVEHVDEAVKELVALGARVLMGPLDVGGGIVLADLENPNGDVFGIIYNPHFKGSIN